MNKKIKKATTKAPTAKFRVGQVLFSISFIENDNGKFTFKSYDWIIRTIRGTRVTAIRKTKFTWAKLSTKNGDWGWAKSIDASDRVTFQISDTGMRGLSLTKPEAWERIKGAVTIYLDPGPYQDMAINTCNQQIAKTTGRRPGGKK